MQPTSLYEDKAPRYFVSNKLTFAEFVMYEQKYKWYEDRRQARSRLQIDLITSDNYMLPMGGAIFIS